MNCLMQKAMRDRVLTNRCVMDSILWFHLECPKNVSKFDDPIEFKRKVRDFFADTRSAAENVMYQTDESRRIKEEYGHMQYPEDIREHKEYRLFQESFKQYSPTLHPEAEDDYETEDLTELDETDEKAVKYGVVPDYLKTRPLTREDGAAKKQ